MKLFIQDKKNLQLIVSSALVFAVCFACLNFLSTAQESNQSTDSLMLPLVLNATEPFLITGNIDRLGPQLEQLIANSNIERVDVHGADSSLLVSVRNLGANNSGADSGYLEELSASIVLDDALAATLVIQEFRPSTPTTFWPYLLISFACAIATAISSLMLNRVVPTSVELPVFEYSSGATLSVPISESSEVSSKPIQDSKVENGDSNKTGEVSSGVKIPINTNPKGHQRMVLMLRMSDLRDQLVRTDDVDAYMDRIWKITERMAETYGISCIGVQSGVLVFTASSSNSAIALRHCIMFGWNLSRDENKKTACPACLIAPIDFEDENPCHAMALGLNEELQQIQERLSGLETGEFGVCKSMQANMPKSVDAISAGNNNLRILSIENRMLDLWKKQVQLQF